MANPSMLFVWPGLVTIRQPVWRDAGKWVVAVLAAPPLPLMMVVIRMGVDLLFYIW